MENLEADHTAFASDIATTLATYPNLISPAGSAALAGVEDDGQVDAALISSWALIVTHEFVDGETVTQLVAPPDQDWAEVEDMLGALLDDD